MEPARRTLFTEDEYLALEYASKTKHEFAEGRIVAMAGGTPRHSLIALNVGTALNQALRGRPCMVFNSDQRVNIEKSVRYTYPDITVVCGEARFSARDQNSLVNPVVIIEVLSESTEQYDLGAKLTDYRRLPSLMAFIAIHAKGRHVEHQQRMSVGPWTLDEVQGDGSVTIGCLDLTLSLDDIYAKVDLLGPVS